MKRVITRGIFTLLVVFVFFSSSLLSDLHVRASPEVNAFEDNPQNDLGINSEEEANNLLHAQNATHYQNYSRITEWEIECLTEIKESFTLDNITYLATMNGLLIYNITNREFPTIISQSFTSNRFDQMDVDNDFVYLFSYYDEELMVLNISDLANPTLVHSRDMDNIVDIFATNGIVFVSQKYNFYGLKIFDYTDLENVVDRGEYSTGSYTYLKIYKKGNYMICTTDESSFEILDISNLDNPLLQISQPLSYDYTDFLIRGDLVYFFSYYGINIANISDIYDLSLYGSYFGFSGGRAFTVKDNFVYVIAREITTLVLKVYEVITPNDINLITNYDDLMPSYLFGYTNIRFNEEVAVISNYRYGFRVVNATDNLNFTVLSDVFGGDIYGVHVEETFTLFEILFVGFVLYNTTDPLNIVLMSRVFIYLMYSNVFIENNLSYCYINNQGLVIHNLTNPHSPQKLGECATGTATKIIVQNGFAFLHYSHDIEIVDVIDPAAPLFVLAYGDYIEDFTIHGNVLYATRYFGASYHYLDTVDISNPAAPVQLNRYSTTREFHDIVTNGSLAFLQDEFSSTIYVYNVENPADPTYVSELQTNLFPIEVLIQDNLIFIPNVNEGLTVFEIDDQLTYPLFGKLYPYYFAYGDLNSKSDMVGDYFYLVTDDRVIVCGIDSDKDYLADYLETNVYGTDPFDSDSDDDLITDSYEVYNNLDPLNDSDASLDYDNDTLTNYEEFLANSNPWLADSDGDLLTDDLEVLYNTDPNEPDTDNDGLTDFEEIFTHFTDPTDSDSDGDTLLDGSEITFFGTNPLKNDTDDDLMDDWFELYHYLNPFINDSHLDLDQDGLTNLEEYYLGTSPNNSDSDMDGYSDLEEIEDGTDPLDPMSHPDRPFYPTPSVLSPIPWLISSVLAFAFLTLTTRFLMLIRRKNTRRVQ